jgi:hypothetical protein
MDDKRKGEWRSLATAVWNWYFRLRCKDAFDPQLEGEKLAAYAERLGELLDQAQRVNVGHVGTAMLEKIHERLDKPPSLQPSPGAVPTTPNSVALGIPELSDRLRALEAEVSHDLHSLWARIHALEQPRDCPQGRVAEVEALRQRVQRLEQSFGGHKSFTEARLDAQQEAIGKLDGVLAQHLGQTDEPMPTCRLCQGTGKLARAAEPGRDDVVIVPCPECQKGGADGP